METLAHLGQIIILNGAPRSGKSSIVTAIQETFDGVWMNLGVDVFNHATSPQYRPGIGLRPGGERLDLEPLVPVLYAALYESIAAHSHLGLNVVADVGHHDNYSQPRSILADCARRLSGLPVLFVGVRCPIDVIMQRRDAGQIGREGVYLAGTTTAPIPLPVRRWQSEVHQPGIYDLEVDTSKLTPTECATVIRNRLRGRPAPTAFARLARGAGDTEGSVEDSPATPSDCPLCSVELRPELHVTTHWRVILNRNQNLLGKCMLVLRRHETSVTALTTDEWADLHVIIRHVTSALHQAFKPDHFNYAFLQNQDRHVHLHVIPRYASARYLGALAFMDSSFPDHYVVGETRVLSEQELVEITSAVQTSMETVLLE